MAWRLFISPVFLIAVIGYAYVRLGRIGWFYVPQMLNDYLADLVCLPIILTCCLAGVRMMKEIPNYQLNWFMVLGMTIFYAVLFEWILPQQSSNHTADWGDVIAYFIGASCYYYFRGIKWFQPKLNASGY